MRSNLCPGRGFLTRYMYSRGDGYNKMEDSLSEAESGPQPDLRQGALWDSWYKWYAPPFHPMETSCEHHTPHPPPPHDSQTVTFKRSQTGSRWFGLGPPRLVSGFRFSGFFSDFLWGLEPCNVLHTFFSRSGLHPSVTHLRHLLQAQIQARHGAPASGYLHKCSAFDITHSPAFGYPANAPTWIPSTFVSDSDVRVNASVCSQTLFSKFVFGDCSTRKLSEENNK